MALHAFSDESKQATFYFATVLVPSGDLVAARHLVRRWLAKGQVRYHAKSEKERTNLRRLRELGDARMPLEFVVVSHRKTTPKRIARERALSALTVWIADHDVARWVIERDVTVESADRRVIRNASRRGPDGDFEYVHLPAGSEPLLWAADLVAWSFQRGGACGRLARSMAVDQIVAG